MTKFLLWCVMFFVLLKVLPAVLHEMVQMMVPLFSQALVVGLIIGAIWMVARVVRNRRFGTRPRRSDQWGF